MSAVLARDDARVHWLMQWITKHLLSKPPPRCRRENSPTVLARVKCCCVEQSLPIRLLPTPPTCRVLRQAPE